MKKFNIVFENKNIIVINKPSGQLTIATDKNKFNNLYHEVREYVKKQYPKNKIFIVHRLDKDTSGLILFAKTEDTKNYLQNNWSKVKREYYAIVHGTLEKKKDTLVNYLKEDKNLNVYITYDKNKGQKAITSYEVIKENKKYSLLRITIETGRKNQIRVQLSNIGHPIVGDKKYGSIENPLKRLCLHAYSLEFDNYTFKTDIPNNFNKII